MKSYALWHKLKSKLNNSRRPIKFHERDIWWVHLGENIGNEQDGKGQDFFRPGVVIKKYNGYQLLVVPLSSTPRINQYRFNFIFKSKQQSALLSQIRVIGSERLSSRFGKMPAKSFSDLKDALKQTI